MKAFYNFIAILFFSLNYSFNVEASHVVGGEISYECVQGTSSGTFRIRLVLYRDCAGISMCPGNCGAACSRTVSISGADSSCISQQFGTVTLTLVNVRDVSPNPDCSNAKSTCTNMGCIAPGPFTPAVERYEFTGLVNLNQLNIPSSCCNIRIAWQECCRNGAISTGSASQNFYLDAVLNRCLSTNPCNSSPILSNDPYALVCGGQPFTFNNGTIDPDLDSLSFSFTPALQGLGASVTYTPPYSAQTPMPWTGPANGTFPAGISCNPLTGDIMFTAPVGGGGSIIGVVALEVKQWKNINGVPTVIGVTRRDIQMVILQCPPNNPPRIVTRPSNIGNQPQTSWSVCAGEQLCFDIVAKDTDHNLPLISDTTKLEWNSSLARFGATLTPNYNPAQRSLLGPREDEYKFCWRPSESMASTSPYYFTITAKDSRCPTPGRTTRAFSVRVLSIPDVVIQKNILSCGSWSLNYNLHANKPNQTFVLRSWKISKEPYDYNFSNGSITFTNVQQTPPFRLMKAGKYLVSLDIASSGPAGSPPCLKVLYDTIIVQNDILQLTASNDTSICSGSAVEMTANVNISGGSIIYKWYSNQQDTLQPLNTAPFASPVFIATPTQTKLYFLRATEGGICHVWDSTLITVKPKPIVSNIIGTSLIRDNSNPFTYSTSSQSGINYLWSVEQGNIVGRNDSDAVSVVWQAFNNGNGKVKLRLANADNCADSAALIVSINTTIKELDALQALKVYPNPGSGELTVSFNSQTSGYTQLELTDVLGKVLLNKKLYTVNGDNELLLQAPIISGVYLLTLRKNSFQQTIKLMVQ